MIDVYIQMSNITVAEDENGNPQISGVKMTRYEVEECRGNFIKHYKFIESDFKIRGQKYLDYWHKNIKN